MTEALPSYVLALSCPDRSGIVYHVSGFLLERGGNIVDADQSGDPETGLFFMRVHFSIARPEFGVERLRREFGELAERFRMTWRIHDNAVKSKLLIMVSQQGHCLNDLLYRFRTGWLNVDIPAVVANHMDFYQLCASYNVPFFHLPVTRQNKAHQEARLMEIVREKEVDVMVLARYMQVLSAEVCRELTGRCINIHHSFLPSFKGAKPYLQAYQRGVKLIGATAHFVTSDLDEGPIIEQDVARVDHSMDAETLAGIGRDVECVVLARAVKWHSEHRIMLNGNKTVVFR